MEIVGPTFINAFRQTSHPVSKIQIIANSSHWNGIFQVQEGTFESSHPVSSPPSQPYRRSGSKVPPIRPSFPMHFMAEARREDTRNRGEMNWERLCSLTSMRKSPLRSPARQATPPSSTDSRYCRAGKAGVGVNSSMGVSAGGVGEQVQTTAQVKTETEKGWERQGSNITVWDSIIITHMLWS